MSNEITIHDLGKKLSAVACTPDKVLVQTLGMTPSIAWGATKEMFEEAFDRKPTEEDEKEFTAGFEIGLLENQGVEIKEHLERINPSGLAGKPVALLGVAAGAIGAIKSLEQLRGVCSHVGAIVLPGPVSISGVQNAFDAKGKCLNAGVEKRVRSVATGLLDYIHKSICPSVALERMVREQTPA